MSNLSSQTSSDSVSLKEGEEGLDNCSVGVTDTGSDGGNGVVADADDVRDELENPVADGCEEEEGESNEDEFDVDIHQKEEKIKLCL
jgi:hypothetical protein